GPRCHGLGRPWHEARERDLGARGRIGGWPLRCLAFRSFAVQQLNGLGGVRLAPDYLRGAVAHGSEATGTVEVVRVPASRPERFSTVWPGCRDTTGKPAEGR